MSTVQTSRPPAGRATAAPPKKVTLADIIGKGSGLPGRYLFYGVPGIGKTSLGAQMPSPVFVQTRGETGLDTLIDARQLPETPHLPACESWEELLAAIEMLTVQDHPYKTLVVDTFNGAEKMLHEYVDQTYFDGQMSPKGFLSYMAGYRQSAAVLRTLLKAFDDLRVQRRMTVALMAHARVTEFKNPEGANFDQYAPDIHHEAWSVTEQWCDAVLFINYEVATTDEGKGKKAKGRGGQQRIMYTQNHAAYKAKNRFGLPEEIELGGSPSEAWAAFGSALAEGRKSTEVKQ